MARDHSRILMTLAGPHRELFAAEGPPSFKKESSSFSFFLLTLENPRNPKRTCINRQRNDVNQT